MTSKGLGFVGGLSNKKAESHYLNCINLLYSLGTMVFWTLSFLVLLQLGHLYFGTIILSFLSQLLYVHSLFYFLQLAQVTMIK